MSIYRTAVNKPVTTALVFIAFAIFGIFSFMKTSIAQLPDFDANVLLVMSSYPGASAADIETNLTKVLENGLNGVSDLKDMTSKSKENISIITLEFNYGVDIEEATNNVRDKLDMINSSLPDQASTPVIFKFSMDDMPILILSATADESLPGLDKILDDKVTTPLSRVKGVGTVSVSGAPTREIQVYCDPNKLQAYGLSIGTVSNIIAYENRNIPSGSIDIGSESFSLRIQKEFKDPSELLDVVLSYKDGNAVYLRDVATIIDGQQEKEQEAITNGRRSAQIVIQKQTGANTVDVIKGVFKEMKTIEPTLPSDIHIETVIDSSSNIINSINSLKETIIITFLVVMLVVYVFLGRWRATFIIILSIPISLMASLVYLFATGNTLNIISMSALSIAIGMVVDDSIVALENITTHIERGEKPKEAAVHGTEEVGISIIASTLTMLCVFLPLTLISGMSGIMFRQLGWIVSIIMIVSTCGALCLVPMLCSRMLRAGRKKNIIHDILFTPIDKGLNAISDGYAWVINWAVRNRKTVIFGAFGIFMAVLLLLGPSIKTEYFPHADQGRLTVSIELNAGTSQEVTGEFARNFYNRVREEVPEIKVCSYTFGQADTDNAFASMQTNGSNIISMNINLGSMEDRKRSSSEIADIIRADLKEYPEIHKGTVSEGMGGMGGAASVAVEIYGYDFQTTDRIANELRDKMAADPAFAQVTLSRDQYTPEYQVDFDRVKLAVNGLNSTSAAAAVSAAMSGSVGSYYREDGEEYSIRVRYAKDYRTSVEDIENIIIYNASGKGIRIKDLGRVVETEVPPTIERKNRQRMITVTGVIEGSHAMSDGITAAQQIIKDTDIPSELSAVIAGDYEDQQDMFKDLITLMILIIILVYMVMASQFESFMSPFVIMFSVPFAFVGVVLGLWLTNTALGVMAMIGILILIGIVVKNGIVLIDYLILLRERGMGILDAAVAAARSRLRPILMTTLTTVLGMIPMAAGTGEGSEMWKSLGITVAWGLSISTVVTLILIPTIYCVFATRQEKRKQKKLARKAAETAALKA
ncbi:MAG: efflux RND transporter permease subunit [Bacteroidales bacterium]|nr:efflux RND transporter permease subunit [Bacteroidales bacterium]